MATDTVATIRGAVTRTGSNRLIVGTVAIAANCRTIGGAGLRRFIVRAKRIPALRRTIHFTGQRRFIMRTRIVAADCGTIVFAVCRDFRVRTKVVTAMGRTVLGTGQRRLAFVGLALAVPARQGAVDRTRFRRFIVRAKCVATDDGTIRRTV